MAFNNFPFLNLNTFNLDWIISKIKSIDSSVEEVAENTQTVKRLTENIQTIAGEVNLAHYVDVLDDSTIALALAKALDESSYIYIPAGSFKLNAVIEKPCHVRLDEGCTLETISDNPIFYCINTTFSLRGGKLKAGTPDMDLENRTFVGVSQTEYNALVLLENCKNIEISNVDVPVSKFASIVTIRNCENIRVENCSFRNILHSGIQVIHYNKNIVINNCSFRDIYPHRTMSWCYGVSTGMRYLTDENVIPPDNLVVSNCYLENSDDCGIDTHGATNVYFVNNRLINCRTSITAYNDNLRIKRPDGWIMQNVVIENNYCESDKPVLTDVQYPHPFIFLGATNADETNDGKPGGYDTYSHIVVRNNYFKSPNNGYENAQSLLFTNNAMRDAVIENNTFDGAGVVNRGLYLKGVLGTIIRNNVFQHFTGSGPIYAYHCNVEVSNNRNLDGRVAYNFGTAAANYFKDSDHGAVWSFAPPMMAGGDMRFDDSNNLHEVISRGIRCRSNFAVNTITGTCSNGLITMTAGILPIEGLYLTAGGSGYYVDHVIDSTHFTCRTAGGSKPANGNITFTLSNITEITVA